MNIAKWLRDGIDGDLSNECETTDDLLVAAGRSLDNACSSDIVGEVLFLGDDGKYYVGCVEFVISEANPDYVDEILAKDADE